MLLYQTELPGDLPAGIQEWFRMSEEDRWGVLCQEAVDRGLPVHRVGWDRIFQAVRSHRSGWWDRYPPVRVVPALVTGSTNAYRPTVEWDMVDALVGRMRSGNLDVFIRFSGREFIRNCCESYSKEARVRMGHDCSVPVGVVEKMASAFKSGRKLTRALRESLRVLREYEGDCPVSEQEIEHLVSSLGERRLPLLERKGWFVVSQLPSDILTISDFACYRSCHSVLSWEPDEDDDGPPCHSMGTQQYLYMPNVWVVYYFEDEESTHGGIKVPYKRTRRLVYVEEEGRACVLSRLYGEDYGLVHAEFLRKAVAETLWGEGVDYVFRSTSLSNVVERSSDVYSYIYYDWGHQSYYLKPCEADDVKIQLVERAADPVSMEPLICPCCGEKGSCDGWFGVCQSCW